MRLCDKQAQREVYESKEWSRIKMGLLVYSANWCRDCREAKRFLSKHSIPFEEVDIERTPGAADQVIANTGKRAIPQFVLDGKWIQPYKPGRGFLYAEMEKLFGVGEGAKEQS